MSKNSSNGFDEEEDMDIANLSKDDFIANFKVQEKNDFF